MKIENKKLSELKEWDENVRIHPEGQIDELVRSIELFGQVRPILVDEDNLILAGTGLHRALVKMGKEEGAVLKIEGLDKKGKTKLMMADNKIYELGIIDNDAMMKALKEIGKDGEYDVPGFDEEVLKNIFASVDDIGDEIKEYGNISKEDIESLTGQNKSNEVNSSLEVEIQNENIEVDVKKRPYILCPKCGEKIWL